MAFRKKPVKGTKGLGEAKENLTAVEDGDCPRCGGGSSSSSIPGYLSCDRCQYEWSDPKKGWDGSNKSGNPVRDGVYFYSMTAVGENGKEYQHKGSVSLYR